MKLKAFVVALCAIFLVSSCEMSNKAKGGIIGGTGGAALGALVGQLIGHNGKSAAIGAAVGTAVGAGAGVLIGNKMDKAKQKAEELAKAEMLQDANGLNYVKVTFDGGILFATGTSNLTPGAQQTLQKFATEVLTSDMDLAIVGFTDNAGWKNCNAEQSKAKNLQLSEQRANSVSSYLVSKGATSAQMKSVLGQGEENPVADNSTAAGKAQNRRVEVYILPSKEMIEAANNGSLK